MEDKFLPLQNRRHFIYKIELAKKVDTANIKATNFYLKINKKSQSSDTSEFNTISMLSVFIGLIASILGAISLFVKQKRDKENQEEVNNEINEAYDSSFGIRFR